VDSDPCKRKGTTQGDITSKKKQRPEISNANLAAHLKQVRVVNTNDSLFRAATKDKERDTEETPRKVTKYITTPILGKKSSLWWESFEQFLPSKHPKLFSEYVMCSSWSKLSNTELGIVKIGISHSTSNLKAHEKYNHPNEYEAFANCSNLKYPQSITHGEIPTSIKNMPGFTTKAKCKMCQADLPHSC
jgi:hypothetical protein